MIHTSNLPRFLKVLITSDGTVSSMLEAWFNEAVVVTVQQQPLQLPEREVVLLNGAPGDKAINRLTELQGKTSKTCYLKAEALILPHRINQSTLDCIQSHEAGIGKALRQERSETLREVLDWGIDQEINQAWRRYRIIMKGLPVMLITERFPITSYL